MKRIVINYQNEQPERLDKALSRELPQFSRRELRKWILQGSVYLGKKRIRKQSYQLPAGQSLRIVLYPFDGASLDALAAKIAWPSRVLYRDDHLLAIDKPAGIPTAPTRESALHHVYAYAQQYGVLPRSFFPFHRLDKDTTGVLLIPLNKRMATALNRMIKSGELHKRYWLVARGIPPADEWEVKGYLSPPRGNPRKVRFSAKPAPGYRQSLTRFRVLAVNESQQLTLIEAEPVTGRTHQIRISAEVSGLSILGDPLYGSAEPPEPQTPMLLHCLEISFRHPVVKEQVRIQASLPDDFQRRIRASFDDIGTGEEKVKDQRSKIKD
ncbi:MAG: RluA family pseudouridine synthase [Methanobacteriota archaeon]|nr:MAG: RluA family pseudouridine synthase [Euryarchaeota archaeon]